LGRRGPASQRLGDSSTLARSPDAAVAGRPRASTSRASRGDRSSWPRLRDRRAARRVRHQPRPPPGHQPTLGPVQAYDPRTNRWSSLPDLPDPRGGTGAAAIAGRVVSVGGGAPGGRNRTVWALSPGSRWVQLTDLATPRHGLGVVALGGRVWAIAGGPEPGLTV